MGAISVKSKYSLLFWGHKSFQTDRT